MLWKKIDNFIYKMASFLCIVSTAISVLLMLCEVATRFIFHISAPWTGDLVRSFYIYIVFFGLILVEREGSQIRTTLLIETFPPLIHTFWETVVAVLSIIFNICLFVGCFKAIPHTLTYLGSLPWISEKIFYYPIVFSVPLAIMYQINHLILLYCKKDNKAE
jgi:TRAP-type C4-dicarboxylate transport system permease small subunit